VEEYMALREHGTFDTLEAEYRTKYSHITIITTMNVQTVKKDKDKKDKDGIPVRAKSQIVVLGTLSGDAMVQE
jgi:hypothetical protein